MLKLFHLSTKKAKKLAILALFFVALQGIFEGLQTLMLANVLNVLDIWTNNPMGNYYQQYWMWSVLLLSNAILSLVCGVFGSLFGTKSSLLMAQNIRHRIFLNATTLSFSEIDKISTASVLTRITNDVQKYQLAMQMILALLIRAPIVLVYGIVTSFIHDWFFGIIFVCIMTFASCCFGLIGKSVIKSFEQVQIQIDNVNKVVRENILGIKVVKSFCLEPQQRERFDIYNQKLKNASTNAWIGFGIIHPFVHSVMYISLGIVFLTSGYLHILGRWGENASLIKTVYELANLLMITLSSLIVFCVAAAHWIMALPSCKRINEFLAIKPSIKNAKNAKQLPNGKLDIEFKNVNFKYFDNAKNYVLKNINLKIKQGENLGIIGSTGSGKSSLVNLITRLYDFKESDKSSLTIANIPIKQIDLDSLHNNVGIVLQEKILFSGTIKYNLLFGNKNATNDEIMHYAKIACADSTINRTNGKLNGIVEQRGKNFSGGQQQRLCITRTLLKKAKILILDDSTSALDMITEKRLQHNIRDYLKGTTIIVVAQRISSVKNCDKIVVMNKGKIVGYDTHEKLLKSNKIYQSIVASQLKKTNFMDE